MKYILIILFFIPSLAVIAQNYDAARYDYTTVAEMMQRASGNNAKVTVNDALRGGKFTHMDIGNNIVDSIIIFPSPVPGKVYVRDMSQTKRIYAKWAGVSALLSRDSNTKLIQRIIDKGLNHIEVDGNVDFDITALQNTDLNTFDVPFYNQVATIEDRDNIKVRSPFMRVYVEESDSVYILNGGLSNSNWVNLPEFKYCDYQTDLNALVHKQGDESIMGVKSIGTSWNFLQGFKLTNSRFLEFDNSVKSGGWRAFNTADDSTNYEQAQGRWINNLYQILVNSANSGTIRPLELGSGRPSYNQTAPRIVLDGFGSLPYRQWFNILSDTATAGSGTSTSNLFGFTANLKSSSGIQNVFWIRDSIRQSVNAGYGLLNVEAVTNGGSVGSGVHLLGRFLKDGNLKTSIDDNGLLFTKNIRIDSAQSTISNAAIVVQDSTTKDIKIMSIAQLNSLLSMNSSDFDPTKSYNFSGTDSFSTILITRSLRPDANNTYDVGSTSSVYGRIYTQNLWTNSYLRLHSSGTDNPIQFLGGSTEWGRFFATTGNFGINTTTDAGYKLDVNGSARVGTTLTITPSSTTALNSLTTNSSNGRLRYTASNNITRRVDNWDDIIYYRTPVDGDNVQIGVGDNIIEPATDLSSLTLVLPSATNGDKVAFSFVRAVTTLTFTNGTLANNITTTAAGGILTLQYYSGTGKWYKF